VYEFYRGIVRPQPGRRAKSEPPAV